LQLRALDWLSRLRLIGAGARQAQAQRREDLQHEAAAIGAFAALAAPDVRHAQQALGVGQPLGVVSVLEVEVVICALTCGVTLMPASIGALGRERLVLRAGAKSRSVLAVTLTLATVSVGRFGARLLLRLSS